MYGSGASGENMIGWTILVPLAVRRNTIKPLPLHLQSDTTSSSPDFHSLTISLAFQFPFSCISSSFEFGIPIQSGICIHCGAQQFPLLYVDCRRASPAGSPCCQSLLVFKEVGVNTIFLNMKLHYHRQIRSFVKLLVNCILRFSPLYTNSGWTLARQTWLRNWKRILLEKYE